MLAYLGVRGEGALHDVEAKVGGRDANLVDGRVEAGFQRVPEGPGGAAGLDHVATAAGLGDVVGGLLVDFLGDGLDAVRVVVGKLGVEAALDVGVDAGVLQADGAELELLGLGIAEGAIGDAVVLALKVGKDGRGKVAAVRHGPDVDGGARRLVLGKLVEPDLGKVPHGARGLHGRHGRLAGVGH